MSDRDKVITISEDAKVRRLATITDRGAEIATLIDVGSRWWEDVEQSASLTWPEIRRLAAMDPAKGGGGE